MTKKTSLACEILYVNIFWSCTLRLLYTADLVLKRRYCTCGIMGQVYLPLLSPPRIYLFFAFCEWRPFDATEGEREIERSGRGFRQKDAREFRWSLSASWTRKGADTCSVRFCSHSSFLSSLYFVNVITNRFWTWRIKDMAHSGFWHFFCWIVTYIMKIERMDF